ncbi:unnamed protein product [Arctogadus glacialis]
MYEDCLCCLGKNHNHSKHIQLLTFYFIGFYLTSLIKIELYPTASVSTSAPTLPHLHNNINLRSRRTLVFQNETSSRRQEVLPTFPPPPHTHFISQAPPPWGTMGFGKFYFFTPLFWRDSTATTPLPPEGRTGLLRQRCPAAFA